jgi:hypothetical protein
MTIIENHFFVVVTSKKQGNGIIESKLYIIYYIYIIYLSVKCQLWPRFRDRNCTFKHP